jgi:riboflavin kinase
MRRPKPDHVRILKELALLGGIGGVVKLSSGDLARRMGISQQSAAGKILDLVRDELISRRMGTRKQALQLTNKAVSLLRREHSDYMRIFETSGKMVISGQVASGLGEGSYYVGLESYQNQFRLKLGMKPYPGTLNLRLAGPELAKLDILREEAGIPLEGFTRDGRTFGTGKCFRAKLGDIDCAVIIPNRSHYEDIIEIISERQIRKSMGLKDGEPLKLEVIL